MRRSPRLPCGEGYLYTLFSKGDEYLVGSGAFDLDEGVAVGDAAAPIGQRVVGEAVGDLAVGMLVTPPPVRDRRHPWPQPATDLDRQLEARPPVEHAGAVALDKAPRLGVGGVELDERAALGRAVLRQVRVAGVEEPRVVL